MSAPRVLEVDPDVPDPTAIREAAEVLRAGGLVAFPTETVYGLGAHALDVRAVRRIFAAKGRPTTNPLIVHVADADSARQLASRWSDTAAELADRFWPGPLTLVVPRAPGVPDEVTAGLDTVGIRVPAHPVARALLRQARLPLAAPSANRYTGISPTTAAHVLSSLGDRVDLVIDAGPTTVGIESTVLDLCGPTPRLLRPGGAGIAEIEAVVGPVIRATATVDDSIPRAAPGMARRHYAPDARIIEFEPGDARVAEFIAAEREAGNTTGALVLSPPEFDVDHLILMPDDPSGYARRLYAALHELDARGCAILAVQRVPDSPDWLAVRDRLARASTR
jgi:L-threonylcarbamoyladenylate synthase